MGDHTLDVLIGSDGDLFTNEIERDKYAQSSQKKEAKMDLKDAHEEEHPGCHEHDHVNIVETYANVMEGVGPDTHRGEKASKKHGKDHLCCVKHIFL